MCDELARYCDIPLLTKRSRELLFRGYDAVHVHTFKIKAAEMALYRLLAKGRTAAQAEIRRLVAEKYCWAVSARILADCYRELVSPTA